MSQTAALPTWVPVYVERAIFDLIPDSPHARESARVAWMWDDLHPGHENELYKWQNEAIRQRRDLIALTERMRELGDRIEAEEGSYWPPKYDTPEPRQIEGGEIPQVEHPVDSLAERIRGERYHTRIESYREAAIRLYDQDAHNTAVYAKEVMLHAVTKYELNKYLDEEAHFAQFEDDPTDMRGPGDD